jgi:hypothetical protein
VEVIEFIINDVGEFLEIIHPRTFSVIFITTLIYKKKTSMVLSLKADVKMTIRSPKKIYFQLVYL